MNDAPSLPIHDALPALLATLEHGTRAVLQAPPGAGKTTRVPLALLPQPWADGARIIMLEPRRLAARAAAGYMARLLGETVGETVGYRVRLDSRVGPRTRIEVVTEGVLTRMLQEDPALDGYCAVIFDEFHERSMHADLGLALALQTQTLLRPELRLLVMSATLEVDAVADLLDQPPIVRSEGRIFPVETIHRTHRIEGAREDAAAAAVARALRQHDGDVLVFLPGAAEIRRVQERLEGADLPARTAVLPLFGDLPQAEQDRALAPSAAGERKVVLATAIAETSITIEGVRVVVDSGLARVPRFSPRTGMTRLVTVPVSRASADQRRGRAGRTAPGVCYRLWTEFEHAALLAYRPPEIMEADLAPLALELAAWGVADPLTLKWIDAPPAAAYAQARELLVSLDALGEDGAITAHGRAMAALATHPRLAHMLLRAQALKLTPLACELAALLAERDVLRTHAGGADPDVRLRLPVLRGTGPPPPGHVIERGALHRARGEARHWRQRLRARRDDSPPDDDDAGVLLALAYPDRVAQQRGARGRFLLRSGGGAAMDAHHQLAGAELIAAAGIGGAARHARIFLAAPLDRGALEHHFAPHFRSDSIVEFDADTGRLRAVEQRCLGALVLDERALASPPHEAVVRAVCDGVRARGLDVLPWSTAARRLRERLAFLRQLDPTDWPDVSDAALLHSLELWLTPHIDAARAAPLRQLDAAAALLALLTWPQRSRLETLAPTHVEVPSGSRIAVDYSDPTSPVLAVRLQEVFGLQDTPRIGGGRVPLTLHLLSPAHRPVQVTRDLASFWRTGYFDVRRDLRGRYPRHYWPDDPRAAPATRRTRPPGAP